MGLQISSVEALLRHHTRSYSDIRPAKLRSSARDRGNDADLIAFFKWRFLVLKEADVFLIHINIDESAHFSFVINQPLFDAGVPGLQLPYRLANGRSLD